MSFVPLPLQRKTSHPSTLVVNPACDSSADAFDSPVSCLKGVALKLTPRYTEQVPAPQLVREPTVTVFDAVPEVARFHQTL